MHAPAQFDSSGSKFSKFAVVALLHVGLVGALLSMKVVIEHKPSGTTTVFPHKQFVPDPPTEATPPDVTEASPPAITPPMMPIIEFETQPAPPPVITVQQGEPPKTDLPPQKEEGSAGGTGTRVAADAGKPQRVYHAALANADACALPSYPAQAARNGDTGTVTLALLIGADGKVGGSRIQRSSGHPELDRAAVAALKLCAFKPATTNGVPEAAWGQIEYVWTLD